MNQSDDNSTMGLFTTYKRHKVASFLATSATSNILFISTTYAQSTTSTIQNIPAAEASSMTNLWIYVAALGISLVLGGLYMIKRARENQHLKSFEASINALETELTPPPSPKVAESELQTLARTIAKNSASELGALAVESEMGSPLFTLHPEGPKRSCPKCDRKFASWMAICPFDSTPLIDPSQQASQARKSAARRSRATKDDNLSRKRCLTCDRRYRDDLTYCPHDGAKLIQDIREEAMEAPSWHLCKGCGEDKPTKQGELACKCDEDHKDHVILDPSNLEISAMIFSSCPECHKYGVPGQTHCKDHPEEVLMPETTIERHALPASGYGPARKLCTVCNRKFSGAYIYCPHDKSRLKHMD